MIGDHVLFVDKDGAFHHALVTKPATETEYWADLIYVGLDQNGHLTLFTPKSIPFKADGMTGNYYWV